MSELRSSWAAQTEPLYLFLLFKFDLFWLHLFWFWFGDFFSRKKKSKKVSGLERYHWKEMEDQENNVIKIYYMKYSKYK